MPLLRSLRKAGESAGGGRGRGEYNFNALELAERARVILERITLKLHFSIFFPVESKRKKMSKIIVQQINKN